MAYIPNSGSVVAFQSDASKLNVTVAGSIAAIPNPGSVSGVGLFNVNHTGAGSVAAVGNVAGAATDLGNPVKVGGIYNTTLPTYTDGQRTDVQAGSRGAINVTLMGVGSANATVSRADNADGAAVSATANNLGNVSRNTVFNGTTWDRMPGDTTAVTVKSIGSVRAVLGESSVQIVGVQPPHSVAALQATNPWIVQLTSGSVITTSTPGNSSVQLVGGTAMIGSVAAYQGVSPWVVQLSSGSVITTGGNSSVQVVGTMPPQSVSGVGTFNIDPQGAGSIIAKLINSSVTAYQGVVPWVVQTTGSVLTQYREDEVATSVIGYPMVFRRTDSASIMGIVSPNNPLPVQGSITALQGTQPWLSQIVTSVATRPGPASVQLLGSNALIGSVAQAGNWFMGPSSVQLMAGTNVIGSVATLQGTNPWVIGNSSVMITPGINTIGSVAVLQSTSPWLVTGSMMTFAYQLGGSVMAVNTTVTTGPSSVQLLSTSASIATQVNRILTGVSSVQLMAGTNNAGSITAIQGTNPWVIANSSVLNLPGTNVIGSIAVLQGTAPWITTTQASSIVGTYAEDTAHVSGSSGLFMLHVRNDTLSSVTSADLEYSTNAVGPVGETVIANAPITKWISGQACVFSGTSVQVLAAQGASVFTYITGIHIANDSANNARVKITSGNGSVLAFTIAPANGGSNIIFANALKTGENQGVSASVGGTAVDTRPSVYVTLTGFVAKI